MPTVKINTSDVEWIERHAHATAEPVAYGTDVKGVMYFTTTIDVPAVEHVKFAGASMIRFDIGLYAPRDHNRWAMYPDTYLVQENTSVHTGMGSHDGLKPHSHEVRPDHLGVEHAR